MLPSRAAMRSTVSPVASLTRTSPLPLTSTVSVSTSVLSCTLPLACTVRSLAMKTDAPSVLMAAASRRSRPSCSSAATMPPRTVSVPSMSSVTLRAGSKPSSPPTKPLSVRFVVTVSVLLPSATKTSRSARSWKLSAGSSSTWMLMKPVSCGVPASDTVSRMSPSPL